MERILNSRIQLKYDTYENWSKTTVANKGANLVLRSGELGIVYVPRASESNATVLFKVGDGKTIFAELPWASALASDVYDWAKSATKPTYSISEITQSNDEVLILNCGSSTVNI